MRHLVISTGGGTLSRPSLHNYHMFVFRHHVAYSLTKGMWSSGGYFSTLWPFA